MPKAGDEYQELVGAVQRALDPGAEVQVGVWIEGPDGRRDMDVSVRGVKDGEPHFILIECKDWKDPVGIAVIDAFESKRRDLGADLAIVFSNSGFTGDAARKARRCDIQLASALRAGDSRVRVEISRTLVARMHKVSSWSMIVFAAGDQIGPDAFHPFDVAYQGLPVVNWIRQDSVRLLGEHRDANRLQVEYSFRSQQPFSIRGHVYLLTGFAYRLECTLGWVSQLVRENVSLGSYDFLRKRVSVPDKQSYTLGPIDQAAWVDCPAPPSADSEMEPGTFELELTLVAAVVGVDGVATPDLAALIEEGAVSHW